jgi:hypothetical protein
MLMFDVEYGAVRLPFDLLSRKINKLAHLEANYKLRRALWPANLP